MSEDMKKNPGTTNFEERRTISLMNHLTKLLLTITMYRLETKVRPEMHDTQFGFVRRKGTPDAIFKLNVLIEISEVQRD